MAASKKWRTRRERLDGKVRAGSGPRFPRWVREALGIALLGEQPSCSSPSSPIARKPIPGSSGASPRGLKR